MIDLYANVFFEIYFELFVQHTCWLYRSFGDYKYRYTPVKLRGRDMFLSIRLTLTIIPIFNYIVRSL